MNESEGEVELASMRAEQTKILHGFLIHLLPVTSSKNRRLSFTWGGGGGGIGYMAFITAVNMANSRRLAVVLTAKQQLWQNRAGWRNH